MTGVVTTRWVLGLIGWPAVVSVAGYVLLRMFGLVVPWWQLWVLSVAATVALRLVRAVPVEEPTEEEPVRSTTPGYLVDRPFAEVNRWEDRMSWGQADADRFNRTVRRRLVELIAQRVWLRHGVWLPAEPDRARALIGDELDHLVRTPVRVPLNHGQLEHIVQRIEEI